MNTSLLAIRSVFVGTSGASPAQSKSLTAKDTDQLYPILADNPHFANIHERTTTDNPPAVAQSAPFSKPPQDFSYELGKKTGSDSNPDGTIEMRSPRIPKQRRDKTELRAKSLSSGAVQIRPPLYDLLQNLQNENPPKRNMGTRSFPTGNPTQIASAQESLTATANNQSLTGLKPVPPKIPDELIVPDKEKEQESPQNANKIPASNLDTQRTSGTQRRAATLLFSPITQRAVSEHSSASSWPLLGAGSGPIDEKPAIAEGPIPAFTGASLPLRGTPPYGNLKQGPKDTGSEPGAMVASADRPVTGDSLLGSRQSRAWIGRVTDDGALVSESPDGDCKERAEESQMRSFPFEVEAHSQRNANVVPVPDNPSGNCPLQKLNAGPTLQFFAKWEPVTELNISTGQTKDNSGSASENGSAANLEQTLSSSSAQIPTSEQTSLFVQVAKAANNSSPGDVSKSISEQIMESIHASLRQADKHVTIRLNPPELGRVFVRFQEQEDQITGLLEVNKAQTRYEIEQVLPQIIRTLEDSGIQIKRLEVLLTDQIEQQADKDQWQEPRDAGTQQYGSSLQSDSSQQQDLAPRDNRGGFPRSGDYENSTNEWLSDGNSYQGNPKTQVQIGRNHIDMLV